VYSSSGPGSFNINNYSSDSVGSINTISDIQFVSVSVDLSNQPISSEEKREEFLSVGNNNINQAKSSINRIESVSLSNRSHLPGNSSSKGSANASKSLRAASPGQYIRTNSKNAKAGSDDVFSQPTSSNRRRLDSDPVNFFSPGERAADMRKVTPASLDGLSMKIGSSHPAPNSFLGWEFNNELDKKLDRPEILTAVDGVQFGGSMDYKYTEWDKINNRQRMHDSSSNPNDKGLISIDSMGHSACIISAITPLEDALQSSVDVDNGDGGERGSVASIGSPYYNLTNPIFEWMDNNNMELDIRSMGEILSNGADLALQISAGDIELWNSSAMDIINESIPQSSNNSDLMHIDYIEVVRNMTQVSLTHLSIFFLTDLS